MSEQSTAMSGLIKIIDDKLKVIDHRFVIINNRFNGINDKIKDMPSIIEVPSPVTPPIDVAIEPVIPLTKPKDDLLDFLSSNRIKEMLKVNGSFDRLEDQVLEMNIYK